MPDLESLKAQAGQYLQSEDFKKLTPYLLSGGAGALAGGAMSGRRREERGESRAGYLARILRNALVTGGLASGSHYLLNRAVSGATAEPGAVEAPAGPAESNVKQWAKNPLLAMGSGGLGLALTSKRPWLGNGSGDSVLLPDGTKVSPQRAHLKSFMQGAKMDANDLAIDTLGGNAAQKVREAAAGDPDLLKKLEAHRRGAGIPSALKADGTSSKWKGLGSTVLRKGLGTFGQTKLTRAKRVGIGTLAALIPAFASTFLNDEKPAS